jgi:hypothetical protein
MERVEELLVPVEFRIDDCGRHGGSAKYSTRLHRLHQSKMFTLSIKNPHTFINQIIVRSSFVYFNRESLFLVSRKPV